MTEAASMFHEMGIIIKTVPEECALGFRGLVDWVRGWFVSQQVTLICFDNVIELCGRVFS